VTLKPVTDVLNAYRRTWKLPAAQIPDDDFSTLAQISQQPPSFEFPRVRLPEVFRFAGPFRKPKSNIPFPWERLDGRPLVYASLGTLQNRNVELFQMFVKACQNLPVQLVLSHGGGLNGEQAAALSANAVVVDYAPQFELLARSRAAITHAGLNTVLDCLTHGVPMVTIPITYEQPAIAERVRWTGCGKVLPVEHANSSSIRHALSELLTADHFRQSASRIASEISTLGGAKEAAECIASVIRTGRGIKIAQRIWNSTEVVPEN
jgi:MGT family glycosyltransferase